MDFVFDDPDVIAMTILVGLGAWVDSSSLCVLSWF